MADEIITTAMERYKLAQDAEDQWRQEAIDDLKFSTGDQWPNDVTNQRILANRPCLTIDQTGPFIRQVTNDQRQNRPSLKFTPEDDATEQDAEVWEGLARHIQADSDADIAYDTACDLQVRTGFGAFRVLTDYCDDTSFDQDIKIKRIKNPLTVSFDPSAIEPDYSDAKWCFVVSDELKADFKIKYPNATVSDMELEGRGNAPQDWMTAEYIRVAEYFTVDEKPIKLTLLSDGQKVTTVTGEVDKKNLPMGWAVLKERDSVERTVMWRLITGFEVLDEKVWPGKYIPIIPVLGEDYEVDGKRVLRGLVRPMKDAQRMYNFWSSAKTEAIALAPKAPWLVATGQIKGYEKVWESANTANWSHLPYNPIANAPPPQRNQAEPPIAAMNAAIQQASDDLSRTTGIFKEGLGAQTNAQSGKAIVARQREGDVATYHFQDNLARAIKHLGRILLDLIPKIYDTPRILRILHEDGSAKAVKINQSGGVDMSKGKYNVAVIVGPSYTTRRQEAADAMTQLIQADPQIMQQAGDIIVHQLDFPGADQLSERLKMFLPPNIQQQDDGQQPSNPADMAKIKHLSDMVGQLSQQIHVLMDEKQTKAAELSSRENMNRDNNITKVQVAAINKESDANLAFAQHQLDIARGTVDTANQMAVAEHAQSIAPPPQPQESQPPPQ